MHKAKAHVHLEDEARLDVPGSSCTLVSEHCWDAAQEELQAARAEGGGADQAAPGDMVAQLEARCAALEEQATELMAETEALAEEGLAKDEEIEALEGKLSHALRQAGAGGAQVSRRRLHGDVMTVHQSKEAEGCIVVMWGLDKRIVCS